MLDRNSYNREIGGGCWTAREAVMVLARREKIMVADYYWPGMETGIVAGGCLPAIDTAMLLDGCWFASEVVLVV